MDNPGKACLLWFALLAWLLACTTRTLDENEERRHRCWPSRFATAELLVEEKMPRQVPGSGGYRLEKEREVWEVSGHALGDIYQDTRSGLVASSSSRGLSFRSPPDARPV